MQRLQRNENIAYFVMWLLVILGSMLHYSAEHSQDVNQFMSTQNLLRAVKNLLPLFALFVINNYILIPTLIRTHRIWAYAISIVLALSIYGLFEYSIFINHKRELCDLNHNFMLLSRPRHQPGSHLPMPFIHSMFDGVLVIGVNVAISLLSRYFKLSIEKKQLEAVNVRGQLDHLKAQINPHFYMNMLNSIHGLIDINPIKAKELVMEMSHLMQYMLYESSKDSILLASEIKFIKDYIRVIHERYPDGKVAIETHFPDNDTLGEIYVPPLLFIVFIENAFKYGVDYRHTSYIHISISIDQNKLFFKCENSKHPKDFENRLNRKGIGLANIKKRLTLLYGGRDELKIIDSETRFTVNLTIPINETKNNNN